MYSFESLPDPATKFKKIFRNIPNVTLFEVAIGPQSGEVDIHLSKRADPSWLLPISKLQNEVFPGTGPIGTKTIRIEPLDCFLRHEGLVNPTLLKIDV